MRCQEPSVNRRYGCNHRKHALHYWKRTVKKLYLLKNLSDTSLMEDPGKCFWTLPVMRFICFTLVPKIAEIWEENGVPVMSTYNLLLSTFYILLFPIQSARCFLHNLNLLATIGQIRFYHFDSGLCRLSGHMNGNGTSAQTVLTYSLYTPAVRLVLPSLLPEKCCIRTGCDRLQAMCRRCTERGKQITTFTTW